MNPDHTFRTVLLIWILLWFPVAFLYRARSLASREKLDRRQEGLPILVTLRPLGGLCLLGIIAFLVKPSSMSWSSLPLPLWLRWVGLGIGVIGAVLSLSTLHNLGKNLTDTVVTRQEHQLVTTGPYRWVRHPFYDAVLLCVLTVSLLMANWFIFVTGCSVFALQVIRTRREEQQLLARFGERYLAYTRQTGGFLPRIRPHQTMCMQLKTTNELGAAEPQPKKRE
jgi:protein-S-isoprenylcysteine O-methyltransferase Ste14